MSNVFFWLYIIANIIALFVVIWREVLVSLVPKIFTILSLRAYPKEEKKVISQWQANLLAITLVISTADVFLPTFVATDAGKDAWISVLLSGLFMLFVLAIFMLLVKHFPDENFADIIKKYFTPVISIPLFIIWSIFLLMKTFLSIREIVEVLLHAFLSNTPFFVLIVSMLFVSGYAVKKGLQTLAKTNDFLLIIGIAVLFFVISMLFQKADFKEYLPILEDGIKPVLKGVFPIFIWTSDIILLLCVAFPYIENKEKAGRNFAGIVIFLTLALESGTLAIAIFGIRPTQALVFAALEMIRTIEIVHFIERIEGILILVWIGGVFVKIAFLYYAVTENFQIWWGLKNRNILVWPSAFVLLGLCIAPLKDIAKFLNCLHKIIPYYTLSIYGMVLIVFLFALFKKRFSLPSQQKVKDLENIKS